MAEPRAPTDEETAPLLDGTTHARPNDEHASFGERLSAAVSEPLTPLSKILIALLVLFLLLSSVFIGLFAGAQHKLNTGHGGPAQTVTSTVGATATATQTSTITAPFPGPTGTPEEKVCLSPSCIELSAALLASIDTSVDPCDSLYDFATGQWRRQHPIPAGKASIEPFGELAVKNEQVIQGVLEPETNPSSDFSVARSSAKKIHEDVLRALEFSEENSLTTSYDEQLLAKLRDFYTSCTNEDQLDDAGATPLVHFVDTLQKLYRQKTTDIESKKDKEGDDDVSHKGLTAAIAFMHSKGIPSLFDFTIDGDAGEDPNAMTLQFSQPSFGLPSKEYFEDESIVELYTTTVQRLLEYFYDDEIEDEPLVAIDPEEPEFSPQPLVANADGQTWPPWPWPPWGDDDGEDTGNEPIDFGMLAAAVVEFEKKIANATLSLDILYQDPIATYNPMPFKNLSHALPEIHFGDYFATMTPRAFPTRVIVSDPTYAHSLSHILHSANSSVVEAYLVFRSALSLSPYLSYSTEPWLATRALEEELRGLKKGQVQDRAEWCVARVEQTLGFAAGRYFVNETFGGTSREMATKVITDIIDTFKVSLKKIDWMDAESADAAADKADALRVKVGFPTSPDTMNPASLVAYYRQVAVDKKHFFKNMLSAASSDVYKQWQKLGRRRDPNEWLMYPSQVNAYYNPPANEIVFPAGILQPPFFQKDWPAYMSYGSFGMVAAHELTHAFDSAGRLYNQEGKLEEWWTNATSEAFNVRAECIQKQYSHYTVDDGKGGVVYVNGNLTSGENIGDSGLIQSYRAWKSQYDSSFLAGQEFVLPGLNYTKDQLFFISFARTWAQNIKPASAVARVRTDPHSPNRYRTDGTVVNIPEFAKAFNCPVGAKLNPKPKDRCLLWS